MNCDGIARWYRALEYLVFGRALERRRFAYLDLVSDARSVLILGDGDGRFTAEFVRRNPGALVDSVDMSARMVELAKVRVGANGKVRFFVGDARTIALDGKYDLIVTHFFMDCFDNGDLERLVAHVAACCEPAARWLVSEFGLPPDGMGRLASRALIRFMYLCFWITTGLDVKQLPDYTPVLARHGFEIARRSEVLRGLLVSELRARISLEPCTSPD